MKLKWHPIQMKTMIRREPYQNWYAEAGNVKLFEIMRSISKGYVINHNLSVMPSIIYQSFNHFDDIEDAKKHAEAFFETWLKLIGFTKEEH